MTIIESPVHFTQILDAGTTEKVLSCFDRGAMSDERLVEVYYMNQRCRPSWPTLPAHKIIRHRERLSADLRLTCVVSRGEHLHAITENLAIA